MHGAAEATQEACFAGKDFSHSAVQEELLCQIFGIGIFNVFLYKLINMTAQEVLHDLNQFFVGELLDCGKSLGNDLVMASMATESKVINGQMICFACLLYTSRCV